MTTLRPAALVTIAGGLVAALRFAQALAAEMAYDGPHLLPFTVPLFLAIALIAVGLTWYGARFLQAPSKIRAIRVNRACAFAMWILLAPSDIAGGPMLLLIGGIYFFVLKPAVRREFGRDEGLDRLPSPTAG